MLNWRKMSEPAKIARGKLQGDDKFMALIEVWVDEGNNRFVQFHYDFQFPFTISPVIFFICHIK